MNGEPSLSLPYHQRVPFVINCGSTRYHVVRTAAASKGWLIEDETRQEPVPAAFHGLDIAASTVRTAVTSETSDGAAQRRCREDRARYDPRRCPQVLWVDRSVVPSRVSALQWFQRLNHFPGMDCIARKAVLFKRLMRIQKVCAEGQSAAGPQKGSHPPGLRGGGGGGEAKTGAEALRSLHQCMRSFYPRSFSSLSDIALLLRYIAEEAAPGDFFIVKPNKGCQGRGIRVTRAPVEALRPEETTTKEAECLIQCYVDPPLLIEGKKFDLRLYALLTCVRPPLVTSSPKHRVELGTERLPSELRGVHLYIHEEGLVRMCAAGYEAPTDGNSSDGSTHLTNYAVNKRSAGYKVGPCRRDLDGDDGGLPQPLDTGNKRDLAFMRRFINALPAVPGECVSSTEERWRWVKRRIDECVVLTVLSGVSVLRREQVGARGNPRSCFELLGFDIMLSGNTLEPVLMEVNHSPSLFCETDFDFHVKQRVLQDTLSLVASYTPSVEQLQHETLASWSTAGAAEEQVIRKGEVRFRQLLPHCVACGTHPESDGWQDWCPEERQRQVAMTRLGGAVL